MHLLKNLTFLIINYCTKINTQRRQSLRQNNEKREYKCKLNWCSQLIVIMPNNFKIVNHKIVSIFIYFVFIFLTSTSFYILILQHPMFKNKCHELPNLKYFHRYLSLHSTFTIFCILTNTSNYMTS